MTKNTDKNRSNILNIIKVGGSIANNPKSLDEFLDSFICLKHPKILVHGGGNAASELCEKLDIPIKMVQGRRITDEASLDVALMVYAGLINKKIVAKLQALSCNALGLTGADLNSIPARRRNHPEIDYGFVGEILPNSINTYFVQQLLDEEIVPVFPAITHDGKGQLFNTNADTIAAALAIAFSSHFGVKLTYCFEKSGVLKDIEDENSRIPGLSEEHFKIMKKDESIYEGMIPKLETGFEALNRNVDQVWIKHAKNLTKDIGTKLSV